MGFLDFWILLQVKPGIRLVYLDNAATSQKPRQVLEELNRFYGSDNSSWPRFWNGVFSVSFFLNKLSWTYYEMLDMMTLTYFDTFF